MTSLWWKTDAVDTYSTSHLRRDLSHFLFSDIFFSLLPPPGILIPPLFLIPAWTTMSAYSVHPHPTHTLTNMRFLHRSLPSFLSSPSSLPSPVGNPVQCDCGCPSWKLWWWLWLLCSEARIVPASLCVCLCVVWVPVCVCVCVCSMHPPQTFHHRTVRPTAGRPRTRATPPPRFSPDASPEDSHYTYTHINKTLRNIHTHTCTHTNTHTQGSEHMSLALSTHSHTHSNKQYALCGTHTFLDRRPQTLHPEVDQSVLQQ